MADFRDVSDEQLEEELNRRRKAPNPNGIWDPSEYIKGTKDMPSNGVGSKGIGDAFEASISSLPEDARNYVLGEIKRKLDSNRPITYRTLRAIEYYTKYYFNVPDSFDISGKGVWATDKAMARVLNKYGYNKSMQSNVSETKPVETKPAETKPVETKPVETKPAETKPVETKPVETKPADTVSVGNDGTAGKANTAGKAGKANKAWWRSFKPRKTADLQKLDTELTRLKSEEDKLEKEYTEAKQAFEEALAYYETNGGVENQRKYQILYEQYVSIKKQLGAVEKDRKDLEGMIYRYNHRQDKAMNRERAIEANVRAAELNSARPSMPYVGVIH